MSTPKPSRGVFSNSMAYAQWGDGPKTLLMIPGGPGNSIPGGWFLRVTAAPILPLLDEGFSIWLVTRKQDMPDGHSVEDMAADYAELIHAEFDGRVDVVFGASYGGIIAQYVAANHSDTFDHIVVALAACEVRNSEVDYNYALALSEGRDTEAGTIMVNSLYPGIPFQWMARLGGRLLARLEASAEHEHFRKDILTEGEAEVAFNSRPVLPTIEVPVLLINGGEDAYFPIDLIEETARLIPNCTSIIYEGKSHVRAATDKRLTTDILEFISS